LSDRISPILAIALITVKESQDNGFLAIALKPQLAIALITVKESQDNGFLAIPGFLKDVQR
jgi:hypothetical protein